MKKLLFVALFVSLVMFALAAEPAMKFEETTLDFGEIDSGAVIDMEFKFVNSNKEPLIIKNISTSCGCTAAKLEKKEYAPGEKGVIPVKFNSRGYQGKVTKSLTISTNDPDNPYTRLKITGKINLKDFATIEVSPDQFELKEIKMGEKVDKKFTIKNTGTIDLRIIEVSHSPELSPVFKQKIIKPGDKTEVVINFTPMQKGRFATFLKIRSNSYKQRLSIVRLNANIEE